MIKGTKDGDGVESGVLSFGIKKTTHHFQQKLFSFRKKNQAKRMATGFMGDHHELGGPDFIIVSARENRND